MKRRSIRVGNTLVGPGRKPFVVAELSGNHDQSLKKALCLVREAARCGVSAVKIQTATPKGLTLQIDRPDFRVRTKGSPWFGRFLYDLYQESCMPWEWQKEIFQCGRANGVEVFSSVFEKKAVDFLETLNTPAYKIASFEINDLSLIGHAARTAKPLILSTGMATLSEISEAVATVYENGGVDPVLLKCTSAYPASARDANLLTIQNMQETFDVLAGVSDHTLGIGVSVSAVALGAVMVEKHFTLDRSEGGVDAHFSMEPHEMEQLVEEVGRAQKSLGCVSYGCSKGESGSWAFRRSLYVTVDMKKGARFTHRNLRSIRPGYGLPPKYLCRFLGKRVSKDVKKGTPLDWALI